MHPRISIRACVRPSVGRSVSGYWVMLLLKMQEKAPSAQFYHCLSIQYIRPFYAFLMPLGRIIGRWALFIHVLEAPGPKIPYFGF